MKPSNNCVSLSLRYIVSSFRRFSTSSFFRFFGSPFLRFSLSSCLPFFLLFCLTVSLSPGALYVFTEAGRLARSTDDGAHWTWLSTPLPGTDCVDMTSDPNHFIYVLTRTGEVHRSIDQGLSWTPRGNIPVFDARAIWVITGLTFVLTQSGDLYQRSNATGNWSLVGNIGASDCVDFVPNPGGDRYLVFTKNGDVWEVLPTPFTKFLLGNIGSSAVIGATTLNNAVLAVTEQGDVARSTNGGVTWNWVGAVSQIPVTGIVNNGPNIYLTTNAGEIVRSTNQGSNWFWRGNVSQVGIGGIISDTLAVIGIEDSSGIETIQILSVYPNPSCGMFTIRYVVSHWGWIKIRLFDILGRLAETCWQGDVEKGDNIVNLVLQKKGVYFLMIESSKARAVKKVILE